MTDRTVIIKPTYRTVITAGGSQGPAGATGAEEFSRIAGATLLINRVVALTSSDTAVYATSADATALHAVGVTSSAADLGAEVTIQAQGVLDWAAGGLTPDAAVYLTTSGQVSHTAPSSGYIRRIGIALAADKLLVDIQPADMITSARQIIAGTGLTGGGNLAADVTLELDSASIASLGLADTAVQPDRQIIAGTGLSGTGNLSADVTLGLDSNSQSSLGLADTAVQPDRQIIAGTGLSGTGNLSADVTIGLDSNSQSSLGLADSSLQPGDIGTSVQAYDAGLASIAGLSTAADQMVYLTGVDAYAVTALTAYARTLLDDADASTARSTLELGTVATTDANAYATAAQGALADTAVQPSRQVQTSTGLTGGGNLSSDLILELDTNSVLSLGLADTAVQPGRQIIAGTGLSGTGNLSADVTIGLDSNSQSSLGLADTSLQPGDIGSTVQAYDAGLASIAGLTTAADQLIYLTGVDAYAVSSLTSAGRALLDDANAAAQIATLGLPSGITSATNAQLTWLGNAETAVTWTGNDASFAGNVSSPVISGTAIVANGTDVTTEVVELAGITTNYTPKKTATGYADSGLSWSGNDASIAGVVGVGGSSNASYGVLSNSLPIAVIRTANDTTDTNVLVTGRGTAAGNTGSIYSTGGGSNNVTALGIKIGSTEVADFSSGLVAVTGAITLTGNLNNKPTHRQTPNLFVKPTTEDTLGYVGAMELSSVVCVADVSGSLNNKYFRLYGAAGTSAALDTTAAEQIIDVWFDVSSGGSAPSTGAGRMIEVDIATDDTAATIAAAIATALNADAAFSAGVDDDTVYIAHVTPTEFTAASAGDSGFTVATESSGSGSLSGSGKWFGGVLAGNGCIYGIPLNSTTVLKIDPVTDTATTFGSLSGSGKWIGGVLAGNGCIYGIPYHSTTVLKIDPATDTATTFGSLSGSSKWIGGVLAGNGCIYGIPYNSTTVLKIDPATDTATTFGSLSGSNNWVGGVLAPNGCIYGIPLNSTTVLKIDPVTDTATTFGSLSGSNKWYGGVLAGNGCIYGIPYSSTTVLKIDPATDTATTFGSLSGSGKWIGGVLAGNGCIYGIPYDSTTVLKIDPATDTATTFGSLSGSNKWYGGVLAGNGCIYGIPYSSTTVLKIDGGLYDVPDYMLSAYVNKF